MEEKKRKLTCEELLDQVNQLKKELNFYKLFAENGFDWEFFFDTAGKIKFINEAFEKITGYSREDVYSGKISVEDIIHPDDFMSAKESFGRAMEKQVISDFALRIIRKDKQIRHINLCSKPVYDGNTFIGTHTSLRDITEQNNFKNLEILDRDLRHSKTRFKDYIENSPTAVFLADNQGKYTYANPSACQLLGYSKEELLRMSIPEIVFPEDRERGFQSLLDILKNGKINNFEISLRRKDGEKVYVILDGKKLGKNENIAFVKDISQRRYFEEENRKQSAELEALNEKLLRSNEMLTLAIQEADRNEKKYKNLFEHAPIGIFRSDARGRPFYTNQAMAGILGFKTPEETIQHYSDLGNQLYLNPERRVEFISLLKKKRAVKNFEYQAKTVDGRIIWLNMDASIQDEQEDGNFFIEGFTSDITERKLAEIEILESKKKAEESDRLKTAFLQNMSHEIRTPMNGIIGFAEMLNTPNLTEDKRKAFTEIVIQSTYQLLEVVNDILAISTLETRQEKVSLQPVSVNRLLNHLYSMFKSQARDKKVGLRLMNPMLDFEKAEIFTDNTKLTQILTNLLSNALKFTHEGWVEFGYTLEKKSDKSHLLFLVKDTGIGIKPEIKSKIFDRFCKGEFSDGINYGGTGLGLSISKGFVELLGGNIWVENIEASNTEPSGTAFYFTIPYVPVNVEKEPPKEKIRFRDKGTILVAEDEEINYQYLKEILEKEGFTPIRAHNGKEAIELCQTRDEIALVLMDIKMPLLDGYSAALHIKEFRPELPIIAQTAYALENERHHYGGAAFDSYITKPIDLEELLSRMKEFIE